MLILIQLQTIQSEQNLEEQILQSQGRLSQLLKNAEDHSRYQQAELVLDSARASKVQQSTVEALY